MRISGSSTYATKTFLNAGRLIVPSAQGSTAFTVADGTTLEATPIVDASTRGGPIAAGLRFRLSFGHAPHDVPLHHADLVVTLADGTRLAVRVTP